VLEQARIEPDVLADTVRQAKVDGMSVPPSAADRVGYVFIPVGGR
jgi:hypothetical protein